MMIRNPLLCICTTLFLTVGICNSQEISKEILLKHVSRDNAGTEFWVTFPPCYEEVAGAENTTRLFVASPVSQPVTVEVPGKGYSVTKMAIANDVIEFKLPSSIGQAYSKPTQGKAPPEKVYTKCGVHITSLSPIVVYGMTRFQYTSDGFLAIPISKLGSDYIIASWPQYTAAGSAYKLPAVSNIVAAYDNTKVIFTMGGLVGSQTTGGLKTGQTKSWKLNAGDVLCFANDDDNQDIAGSRVVSDKPVGVVSGNQCANIPDGVPWCDFTEEMELPITTWGKEYHVTPIVERMHNPIIRVFAHPDYKNVKVYRDGKEWKTLSNKSRMEGDAFFETRAYEGMPHSTIISANAPIYVMLYNTGQADDNVSSDPFQMVLTPIEQYQTEITFSTPNAKGGTLPFTRNFLNIVYATGDGNVIPQDLEFGSIVNGKFEWRTVASRFGAGPGQMFVIKSSNGEQYAMKRVQLPGDGVFRLRAKKPFVAYAYGHSDYDSYGFPASATLNDLSAKRDTLPPEIMIDKEAFDGWSGFTEDFIQKGNTSQGDTIRGIISSICLTENSENMKLINDKVTALKTDPITWSVKAIDPTKDGKAIIVVSDKTGNYSYKELAYKMEDRSNLKFGKAEQLFVNITTEYSAYSTLMLQNLNELFPIKIVKCTVDDTENFSPLTVYLNEKIINPGEIVIIPYYFVPKKVGNYSTTLSCTTEINKIISVELKGRALQSEIEAIGTIEFDTTVIGELSEKENNMIIQAASGEFYSKAKITKILTIPNGSIAFADNIYGDEGFSLDTNLILNRDIMPNNNGITVPIRFRAVKEGVHFASIYMYLSNNKLGARKDFIGYGKTVSVVYDEPKEQIRIFTDINTRDLIIRGKLSGNFFIYNQLGEHILSGTIPEGRENYTISVQNLPAGVYFFTTEINGKRVQEKFVVMR